MKKILNGRILTIPNLLSLIRILLIPLFVWYYLKREDGTATAIILAASGLTDAMDGFIARRFNMISDFGKALDPLADKLTQLAMLCCLVLRFPRLIWLIIVLCVKEIILACIQLLLIKRTDVVQGSAWHGKVTTILIYAVMLLHLLWPELPEQLSLGLEMLCIGMLLLSGVLYGVHCYRSFLELKRKDAQASEEQAEQTEETEEKEE